MRSSLIFTVLGGLAAAQDIDFAVVNAAPQPAVTGPAVGVAQQVPSYKPAVAAAAAAAQVTTGSAASRLVKRVARKQSLKRDPNGDCGTEPDGYGPTTSPDTADAFLADPQYDTIAESAPTPQGYSLAFSALQGATTGSGYMGLYTMQSYNTIACQQHCDAAEGCEAFNFYLERDPSVNPADGCPDPASITNFKCTLWGLPVSNATATNTGQYRDVFEVVISGSNGYNKLAPPPSYDNFTGPSELGGAINAPDQATYLGVRFYSGIYDPGQCAAACQATTAFDSQSLADSNGDYMPCNFFNSYVLSKNNNPLGTYCSMYSVPYGEQYATNVGQYDGDGNYYSVSQSYGYILTEQDPGHE